MLKFLKIILFLVSIAFSFVLGVRFSDNFKELKDISGAVSETVDIEVEDNKDAKIDDNTASQAKSVVVSAPETTQTKNEVVDIITSTNQNDANVVFEVPSVPATNEQQFQPIQVEGYNPTQVEETVSDEISINGQPVDVDQNVAPIPTIPTTNEVQQPVNNVPSVIEVPTLAPEENKPEPAPVAKQQMAKQPTQQQKNVKKKK